MQEATPTPVTDNYGGKTTRHLEWRQKVEMMLIAESLVALLDLAFEGLRHPST